MSQQSVPGASPGALVWDPATNSYKFPSMPAMPQQPQQIQPVAPTPSLNSSPSLAPSNSGPRPPPPSFQAPTLLPTTSTGGTRPPPPAFHAPSPTTSGSGLPRPSSFGSRSMSSTSTAPQISSTPPSRPSSVPPPRPNQPVPGHEGGLSPSAVQPSPLPPHQRYNVFDKDTFYRQEAALTIDQRRMRYKNSNFLTLNDIVNWPEYSRALSGLLGDVEREKALQRIAQEESDFVQEAPSGYGGGYGGIGGSGSDEEDSDDTSEPPLPPRQEGPGADEGLDNASEEASESDELVDIGVAEHVTGEDAPTSSDPKSQEVKEGEENTTDEEVKKDKEVKKEARTAASIVPNFVLNRKVSIWQGDITRLEIGGIVNAANEALLGGGGIDGAIHSAAGPTLREECALLNGAEPGETKVSLGHNIPATKIYHTVGPRVESQYSPLPKSTLKSCYDTTLNLLRENKTKSIAFNAISTGIFGYPIGPATYTAVGAVRDWLEDEENAKSVHRIIFCVFSDRDREMYQEALQVFFPLTDKEKSPSYVRQKHLVYPEKDSVIAILDELTAKPPTDLGELIEALRRFPGNATLDLTGLEMFFSGYLSEEHAESFFGNTIEVIIRLAREHYQKTPAIPYLPPFQDTIANLQAEDVSKILASAFFCIGDTFSFKDLFRRTNALNGRDPLSTDGAYYSEEQAAKIECLICYFDSIEEKTLGQIIVRKKVYRGPTPQYDRCRNPLFHFSQDRFYDLHEQMSPQLLQLYGVRQAVGSDVFGPQNHTQFERRAFISPDLLILSLISAPLKYNECLEVHGISTYSHCVPSVTSYFTFKGKAKFAAKQPRFSSLLLVPPVVLDSPVYSERKYNIIRNMDRLYCAMLPHYGEVQSKPTVHYPTGVKIACSSWGSERCFGGDLNTSTLMLTLVMSVLEGERLFQDIQLRFCGSTFEEDGDFKRVFDLVDEIEDFHAGHVIRQIIDKLPPPHHVKPLPTHAMWPQLEHRVKAWKIDQKKDLHEKERRQYAQARKQAQQNFSRDDAASRDSLKKRKKSGGSSKNRHQRTTSKGEQKRGSWATSPKRDATSFDSGFSPFDTNPKLVPVPQPPRSD
eukprot:TRINITY_DN1369_c0_g1_i1.p1 TRINITY_DN1369_c0_g1~~TRINITY_DN1369_c0_g1_i1.p1  ORF type:complete len:1089 (-),score=235.40 TRINITY_DN1369_c0_g1_i1:93-3359(-)